jgi:hypothetical protein
LKRCLSPFSERLEEDLQKEEEYIVNEIKRSYRSFNLVGDEEVSSEEIRSIERFLQEKTTALYEEASGFKPLYSANPIRDSAYLCQ